MALFKGLLHRNESRDGGQRRVQLPMEIWVQIIEVLCDRGEKMHFWELRKTMCALQLTCRGLYSICTPIIYRHCFIRTTCALKGYLNSIDSADYPKVKPHRFVLAVSKLSTAIRRRLPKILSEVKISWLSHGSWVPDISELPDNL